MICSSRGSERQAGSLSYLAPRRLCGGVGDTFQLMPLSRFPPLSGGESSSSGFNLGLLDI